MHDDKDATAEGRREMGEDLQEFHESTLAVAGVEAPAQEKSAVLRGAKKFDLAKTALVTGPAGPGLLVGRLLEGATDTLSFMPVDRPAAGFTLSPEAVAGLRDLLNRLVYEGDGAFWGASFALARGADDAAEGGAA